jgi:hypothetical protein
METYRKTISWLKFHSDLTKAVPELWTILGRVAAQEKLLRGIPLTVSEARSIERELCLNAVRSRFAQDGILISNETMQPHFAGDPKAVQDPTQQEVQHLIKAWLAPFPEGSTGAVLTTDRIQEIHTSIVGPSTGSGWRTADLKDVPSEMIGLFMEELCDWLNGTELRTSSDVEATGYAVIRLLLAELYVQWIQPFETGQARTSGSIGREILAAAGVSQVIAHLLAVHIQAAHSTYQRIAEECKSGNADPIPFLLFGLQGLATAMDTLHQRVRLLQVNGQWRAQLFTLFNEANDAPTRRQRQVLLDLGEYGASVPLAKLPSLTPALAALYSGVSEKTLRRDVDALSQTGLLVKDPIGLQVDRSSLLAFKD